MSDPARRVQAVPAEATFALRQRVLRPHQRPADLALPGDDDPTTVHLAALSADGDVVGTLRLQPVRCPWAPEHSPAWQLRSMAIAEQVRGRGVGTAMVVAARQHIADEGGGLLWCNARVSAQGFYEKAGFGASDQRFDDPQIGPHVGMSLLVRVR